MKLSYDPRYNIAYISLRDKTEKVDTLKISDEVHLDIGPDGTLYGIELLNANEQLKQNDQLQFTLVNSASGNEQRLTF